MRDESGNTAQNEIEAFGSITLPNSRHVIHCVDIIGQVEGHFILPPDIKTTKYEHVIPVLAAVEQDRDIEGMLMIINTAGGDVEAGLAIAELVAGMSKPAVSLVVGGGHSIGVPLAVSAKRSFIAPSASMIIHPLRMNGSAPTVPQTLNYFARMQERLISFIADNSNIRAERLRELMMTDGELLGDVGSVLDGRKAVCEGLIDSLGGLSDAIECLYGMIEKGNSK